MKLELRARKREQKKKATPKNKKSPKAWGKRENARWVFSEREIKEANAHDDNNDDDDDEDDDDVAPDDNISCLFASFWCCCVLFVVIVAFFSLWY